MIVNRLVPLAAFLAAAAVLAAGGCKRPAPPRNPAEMKEKLADKLDVMLWKIDATDSQKKRFDRLLDGLSKDLFHFQQESRVLKRKLLHVLEAERIDRGELATLRKAGTDLFDRYMARMADAAVEAAGILTLKQRRKLLSWWKEWEFGDEDDD